MNIYLTPMCSSMLSSRPTKTHSKEGRPRQIGQYIGRNVDKWAGAFIKTQLTIKNTMEELINSASGGDFIFS